MLPDFLFGSYKQYKTDTTLFTTWLVETGRKCGYYHSVDPAPRKAGGGDEKGANTIPLRDFTLIAKKIARAAVAVPADIARSARRAIASRKRCNDWFGGMVGADEVDEASTASHGYFIRVLEETLALLVGEEDGADGATGATGPSPSVHDGQVKTSSRTTSCNNKNDTGFSELANRFESLEVEVPSNITTKTGKSVPTPQPSSKPSLKEKRQYQIQEAVDNAISNFIFHWFCFFEDARQIRDFLKDTWSEYHAGNVNLMAAATTTNLAFDLVRNSSDELLNAYPATMETQNVPMLMYGLAARRYNVRPIHPFVPELADVADWCLLLPTEALKDFIELSQSPEGLKKNADRYKPDEQPKDRSSMLPPDQYEQDRYILHNLLPGILDIAKYDPPFFARDDFTEGARYMMVVKLVPMWVAFAAQVLLDIHHILGSDISKPSQQLRLAALRNKKITTQMLDPNDLLMRQYLPLHGGLIHRINAGIDSCITTDPWRTNPRTEACPLTQNPILSGLLMFSLNLRMNDVGLVFARAAGGIMSGAYIYNLVQQQEEEQLQYHSPRWPDMDKFIEFHTEKWVYVGGRPKNAVQGLKKLSIMFGSYKATGAAKTGLKDPRDTNFELEIDSGLRKPRVMGIPKEIKTAAPVSTLFMGRNGSDAIDYSMNIVSDLVREFRVTGPGKEGNNKNNNNNNKSVSPPRTRSTFQSLSQIDLLSTLRDRLVSEEPRLIFNYVGMTVRCYDLLRSLRRQKYISDKVMEYCGSDYITIDLDLPRIVPFIFHNAKACYDAISFLKLKPDETPFSITVMAVGDVLDAFVRGKGAVACRELRAFCTERKVKKQDEEEEDEGERIPSTEKTDGAALSSGPTLTPAAPRPVLEEGKDYYRTSMREVIDDLASAELELGVMRKTKE